MAGSAAPQTPSEQIDARIDELDDWRGTTLARVRRIIHKAVPDVVEEWKWRGVPVWEHDGIICTGETYKAAVKLTFAKGAALDDPAGLFNSSLEGNVRRAIDIHEGEKIDEKALTALVRAAAALNASTRRAPKQAAATKKPSASKQTAAPPKAPAAAAKKVAAPKRLSGGNPQIAKADGDAPVQAYIEAMPGWQRDVGRRLDALIVRTVPKATKAVKWNSPFYGIPGQGWFVSFHTFAKYVKVTFFAGTELQPVPPGGTAKDARWIDVHADDLDEAQLVKWLKQAAKLAGWATADIA